MSRNYRQEYRLYQGTPIQKKRRAKRNKARRMLMKAGRVRKGDGKDVDHRNPLALGGSNSMKNLRVVSKSTNRAKNLGRGGRKRKR